MSKHIKFLITILVALSSITAFAEDEDFSRALLMTCDYSDYKSFQYESVSVNPSVDAQGEEASAKTFSRGASPSQSVSYRLNSGRSAECIYPSGNRVKVKVGTGIARPYGMCGGDPAVFISVWVNKRKVLSRHSFAGHCMESDSSRTAFGLTVWGSRIRQCQKAMAPENFEPAEGDSKKMQTNSPLPEACVNFPEVSRFPVDAIEYPPKGVKPVVVGSIQSLRKTHPVCDEVAKALPSMLNSESLPEGVLLKRPIWSDASETLQTNKSIKQQYPLRFTQESFFDFNNDGKPDRVLNSNLESTYMDGSVLLVQLGNSRQQFHALAPLNSASSQLLSCQMDKVHHDIDSCPPLTQESDDAGFFVPAALGQPPIRFRARYTHLDPFFYRGTTYLVASSKSSESMEYFAVLKPLPNSSFLPMCLFREVPENF